MSCSRIISEAVQRLRDNDLTLKYINLYRKNHTDQELVELIECLLAHPNIITALDVGCNQITDKTGVKLAHYLLASTTIEMFGLYGCRFGEPTYLAIAAALRVNTSLRFLYLMNGLSVNMDRVTSAFIDAIILNPNRPDYSCWTLFTSMGNDYRHLKAKAKELGHPSMQSLLATV